jgi:cell wall assembly regulator SMI1
MDGHAKLKKLIRELVDCKKEYARLAFDEEEPIELAAPCTPKQIAKLEGRFGRALPPSYRAFLELHNGWDDYFGSAKLLAVEDHEQEWVKEKVHGFSGYLNEFKKDNPFKHGAMPIMLGKDERIFVVVDPSTVRKDGEMDFVQFDITVEESRHKDFLAYLEYDLETGKELIEQEKTGKKDSNDED